MFSLFFTGILIAWSQSPESCERSAFATVIDAAFEAAEDHAILAHKSPNCVRMGKKKCIQKDKKGKCIKTDRLIKCQCGEGSIHLSTFQKGRKNRTKPGNCGTPKQIPFRWFPVSENFIQTTLPILEGCARVHFKISVNEPIEMLHHGIFNHRNISGSTRLSQHARGDAIDGDVIRTQNKIFDFQKIREQTQIGADGQCEGKGCNEWIQSWIPYFHCLHRRGLNVITGVYALDIKFMKQRKKQMSIRSHYSKYGRKHQTHFHVD